MRKRTVKLTREQRQALAAYKYCLRQEDRYFGSVFLDATGTAAIQAKTRVAFEALPGFWHDLQTWTLTR